MKSPSIMKPRAGIPTDVETLPECVDDVGLLQRTPERNAVEAFENRHRRAVKADV